ncbi:hypothetical protein [Deinococcus humi]|uniref:Uncharacterized protein n=1 Tax=Deinococcus humi TaxID=662880 RepID=A0A7W8JW01_9DEIO|nr:hypothetical protein [Deinococcus humi]MBB5364000.1 hypothetical protein [Deinococcus humi]GGO32706.1 hypothetical protein GCM10008949_30670 [Deinococcus humi]
MSVDARPFRQLTTPSGAVIKAGPPKLNPLALGVSGRPGGVVSDNATHTIPVYVALGNPPADLVDNALVTVDVEPDRLQSFRILRNGIDKQAGIWKLYVRAEADTSGYEP